MNNWITNLKMLAVRWADPVGVGLLLLSIILILVYVVFPLMEAQ